MKNILSSLNMVQMGFAKYLGVRVSWTGKASPRKGFVLVLVSNEDLARE